MQTDSTINPDTPDLVTGVHTTLVGIDDITGITASMGVYIRLEAGTTFIGYSELTDEIVSGWITGVSIIEDAKIYIEKQISEKRSNSAEGMTTPPWLQRVPQSGVSFPFNFVSMSNTATLLSEITQVTTL